MAGFPLPLDYGMACVRSERREDRQESESDAMRAQVLLLKRPAGRRTAVQDTREGDICLQAVAVSGQRMGSGEADVSFWSPTLGHS